MLWGHWDPNRAICDRIADSSVIDCPISDIRSQFPQMNLARAALLIPNLAPLPLGGDAAGADLDPEGRVRPGGKLS